MESFTKNRNTKQAKTPSGHPNLNNVKTVIKPMV